MALSGESIRPLPENATAIPTIDQAAYIAKVAKLVAYGIPEDQAAEYAIVQSDFSHLITQPQYTRRETFGLLTGAIGTLALTGIATALLIPESPTPRRTIERYDNLANVEPITNSLVQGGRVLLDLEEIKQRAQNLAGQSLGFFISGTDAMQYYERNKNNAVANSGMEIVWKDGFEYVQFTMRPESAEQTFHSFILDAGKIISRTSERLPQAMVKASLPGTIELFIEEGIELYEETEHMHTYINTFGFMFPDKPPFLTVRKDVEDMRVINKFFPENIIDIPSEIPITYQDAMTNPDNAQKLRYVRNLADIYLTNIILNVDRPEYQHAKALFKAIDESLIGLIDDAFGPPKPRDWPIGLRYTMRNYLFHPASYIDAPDDIKKRDMGIAEDFLTSILYFAKNPTIMEEFRRRLYELDAEIPNPQGYSMGNFLDAMRIIQSSVKLLAITDYEGLRQNLPALTDFLNTQQVSKR